MGKALSGELSCTRTSLVSSPVRQYSGAVAVILMLATKSMFASTSVFSNMLGLPWSGKNVWKMKFFLGQGKVREFCGWPGKLRRNLESQGKVREFENR